LIVKVIDVYPDDYPDPTDNPTKVRMGGYQQLDAWRRDASASFARASHAETVLAK